MINNKKCKHNWAEIDGTYAVINMEKRRNGVIFDSANGIPLIIHVCNKCSELKLYSARALEKIE